ncbi:MAG: NifB/NifX family molybdenum-iron cluster-binding protein [Candidatus Aminicenantes bacterium]|jgi:predicted Fe-Mo cluster-binding NifX family protein
MKKTGIIFIFILVFILGAQPIIGENGDQPKKIAIASDGETTDSQVGRQGARCRWLLFFDEDGELTEALENPYWQQRGSAGINCAELLADKKVTVFIATNIGNKMAGVLDEKDITFISHSGTVEEALKEVLEKQY